MKNTCLCTAGTLFPHWNINVEPLLDVKWLGLMERIVNLHFPSAPLLRTILFTDESQHLSVIHKVSIPIRPSGQSQCVMIWYGEWGRIQVLPR